MANPARDHFVRYYTEKMWDWIPAVYRNADGEGPNPGVLRAIVESIAEQAAVARRSIDRVWEDHSVETADDWAVPLMGQLVATRLVPALNRRARRVDVARTIHYRRRSGTLHVLDQLLVDISGWDGAVVESFRTLGRTFHGLDPLPLPAGRYTDTPRGGVADIRRPRGVELVGGPWDEFAHTADLRRHQGRDGRHSIRALNHHIYRQRAFAVRFGVPYALTGGAGRFTFDPSGRDTPLFMPAYRPEGICKPRREWDVEGPIRCRLLGHAEYFIEASVVDEVATLIPPDALTALETQVGLRFRDEHRMRATFATLDPDLDDPANINEVLARSLTADSAKSTLLRDGRAIKITRTVGPDDVQLPHELCVAGNLSTWTLDVVGGKLCVIDPVRGRFWFLGAAPPAGLEVPLYHYGFTANLGAGAYDRRRTLRSPSNGIFTGGSFVPPGVWMPVYTFEDSLNYTVADVVNFESLTLQVESFERPYLRAAVAEGTPWVFRPNKENAELVLDGLWYGGGPLVLDGDFKKVTIRHCTLDPGGLRADGSTLDPVVLRLLDGTTVNELVIESSIFGDIEVLGTATIAALKIYDSIGVTLTGVIDLVLTELTVQRSTLDVAIRALRIEASEMLALRPITVTDQQNGCVRYSVVAPLSQLPAVYEGAHMVVPAHAFVSRRFADPGYFQLSESAPEILLRGAENGSEIGAFSSLLNPLKHDSLRTKVHEFMPFGRTAAFIRET